MTSRNTALDHVKAVACLVIVCHHLAFYGPMSDVLRPLWPGLLGWLDEYGRMAVQLFLVLGGYWAAAALAPQGQARHANIGPVLGKRFVRLCLPYSAALACAIVVNEVVNSWGFDHASVSATPTWDSVLAHLLLVQSLGDWEALSAGVWYVAIDFQLYALCLVWLWCSRRLPRWPALGQTGLVLATAASLWVWNLDSSLDVWALYFLGAYGLGMMAWWATHTPHPWQRWGWVALMLLLTGSALLLEWRTRIAIAGVTALALVLQGLWLPAGRWPQWPLLTWMGQRSYAIFLIHFPTSLLVNALVTLHWPQSVTANALGMLAAVLLSVVAGAQLFRWTEQATPTWQLWRNWQLGVLATGWVAATL